MIFRYFSRVSSFGKFPRGRKQIVNTICFASANNVRNSISMFYDILNIDDDFVIYQNNASDTMQVGELLEKFKPKVIVTTSKLEFPYNKTIISILSESGGNKKKIGGVVSKPDGLLFYLSIEVNDYKHLLIEADKYGGKRLVFVKKDEELDYRLEMLLSI